MAAVVANGRVNSGEGNIHMKMKQECNGSGEKLLNGKMANHKNGYVKSTHLSHSDTVSRFSIIFITFPKS